MNDDRSARVASEPMPCHLRFTPFAEHQPGTVLSLLSHSYAAYLALDPQAAGTWPPSWAAYDREVYYCPTTVGACGFVTCLDREPVGFASWDRRSHPIGIVGHNCVLPAFRGRGYGTAQIRRVLEILRARGFRQVRVTTGDHPFFLPAQRMYAACGFREVARGRGDPHVSAFGVIEYHLVLPGAAAETLGELDT
jgi:GNAT superfamily N-acetyltransferase